MKKSQPLGLDELMIVNPDPPDSGSFFLGQDCMLYQVQGLGQEEEVQGLRQFFLGDDGTLYHAQGFGLGEDEVPELGHFFLGEDGALYEVVSR